MPKKETKPTKAKKPRQKQKQKQKQSQVQNVNVVINNDKKTTARKPRAKQSAKPSQPPPPQLNVGNAPMPSYLPSFFYNNPFQQQVRPSIENTFNIPPGNIPSNSTTTNTTTTNTNAPTYNISRMLNYNPWLNRPYDEYDDFIPRERREIDNEPFNPPVYLLPPVPPMPTPTPTPRPRPRPDPIPPNFRRPNGNDGNLNQFGIQPTDSIFETALDNEETKEDVKEDDDDDAKSQYTYRDPSDEIDDINLDDDVVDLDEFNRRFNKDMNEVNKSKMQVTDEDESDEFGTPNMIDTLADEKKPPAFPRQIIDEDESDEDVIDLDAVKKSQASPYDTPQKKTSEKKPEAKPEAKPKKKPADGTPPLPKPPFRTGKSR
jgi:hypothetical protein